MGIAKDPGYRHVPRIGRSFKDLRDEPSCAAHCVQHDQDCCLQIVRHRVDILLLVGEADPPTAKPMIPITTALMLKEMIGGYQSGLTPMHPRFLSRLSSLIARNSEAGADVGGERGPTNSLMMNPRNAKGPLFRVEPLGVEFGASPECPVPWGARGTGG